VSACATLVAACGAAPTRSAKIVPIAAVTTVVASTTTTTTLPLVRYRVIQGDTLTAIAGRFGVSVAAIAAANHIPNPDQLTLGLVLTIPPAPPGQLVIVPVDALAGATFELDLTGAKPSQVVVFEIDSPDGGRFTGPPHTVQPDGSASASYVTMPGDSPGTYRVQASGPHGVLARASFHLDAAPFSP